MVYLTRQSCSIYSKLGYQFSRFEELRRRIRAELPRGGCLPDRRRPAPVLLIGQMDHIRALAQRGRELARAAYQRFVEIRLYWECVRLARRAERAPWYKIKKPTDTQAEGKRELFERG